MRRHGSVRHVPEARPHGRPGRLHQAPTSPGPAFSIAAGRCWAGVDVNLELPSAGAAQARCKLRYATLNEAQVACFTGYATQREKCRGVAQDNGLACGLTKLRFELRSDRPVVSFGGSGVESGTSWLPLPVHSSTESDEGGAQSRCAQRASVFRTELKGLINTTLSKRRSDQQAKVVADRSRLKSRCHVQAPRPSAWRVLSSDAEEEEMLDGRPLCPQYRDAFSGGGYGGRPHCCTSDVARLLYDPCARHESSGGQRLKLARHARLARQAAAILSPLRTLLVGDSVHLEWADALILDLNGRGLFGTDDARRLRAGGWTAFRRPSGLSWCHAP